MTLKNLYYKSCCVMPCNRGFGIYDIKDNINKRRDDLKLKLLPLMGESTSFDDPFIFKTDESTLNLIYIDSLMAELKYYRKKTLNVLYKNFEPVFNKQILDFKCQSSYPFLYKGNDTIYILPEGTGKRKVTSFKYDINSQTLTGEKKIIDDLSLIDSTIYNHKGKYWIFATLGDHQFDRNKPYKYYADFLFGNYNSLTGNPVKFSLKGKKTAGNIIGVNNELYRPAQDHFEYYGKSIINNKVLKLSAVEFLEEPCMEITADKNTEYCEGLHTINFTNDIVVVDGIKIVFMPSKENKIYFKKRSLIKK